MNKTSLIVFILSLVVFVSCSSDEFLNKFSFVPENPQPGEEIEIRFKSDVDLINNSNEISMLVYSYSKELDNTEKVKLEKMGEGWIGKYTPADSIKGLIIKFVAENGKDDNDQLGYVIKLTDSNGDELVGTNAGLASVYTRYAGTIDLIAAKDSASKYFDMEFEKNPELKREYLSQYFNSFPRSKRNQIAEPELLKLEEEENLSQTDYETLVNGFRTNRDFEKAEKYYKIIKKNYPDSRLVSARYYTKFRNMITAERMIEVFNEFNKLNSENNLNNYMVSTIIRKHAIDNNYDKVQEMLDNYSQYTKSNIYNTLAWNIFEADGDMSKASQFCEKGIKLAREHVNNPMEDKPVYMDKEDWENSRKYSLAMILDTHGNIQNKLGNKAEALALFEEAVNLTGRSQADINENYIKLLFDMEKYELAKNVIEEEISKGKATESMRSLLANIFSKEGGSDEKFDEYIEKFDNAAKKKIQAKLKHEMKNEPAPDFELLNMDGKTVKLSDYKGKTIVLDFWATWCGPCLQSFPVMKKAVEKYADNPNVEFIFVNTWERVPEKKKNAEEFLQRTKYPFHVLLDDQNEVVEKFKVQGIPTKFIIDGNSNIRFQSVGFSGVEKEVLEELDQMIEMTQ